MGDFKPSDLFLGVVQLFAVLLPGALLTAGILIPFGADIRAQLGPLIADSSAGWVAFAVVSYALGAFVFTPASWFDALADGQLERGRERKEARVVAEAKAAGWQDPEPDSKRRKLTDHAFRAAEDQRSTYFDVKVTDGDKPLNTFSWAKAMLMLQAPSAFNDVQRLEAESKFFRSMVIVAPSVGLLAIWAWQKDGWQSLATAAGVAMIAMVLSWWRYVDRRGKAVEWACRYVVTLRTRPAGPERA